MAVKLSVAVRNARLDAIDVTVGAPAKLRLRTGAPPATCATADSGTLVADITLPSPWMDPAAGGAVAKASGAWTDASADAGNTVGHFRIYDNAGTTCHVQGTVTATAGGGDMTLDNPVVTLGQSITITGFTLTDGNGP